MLFLYLSCLVTFICVVLVDGFDFENKTCSSDEDCPTTSVCIYENCYVKKNHGDACEYDRECQMSLDLSCKDKTCKCVSGLKWLRTRCVYSAQCDHNSDCSEGYHCNTNLTCVESGLSPAQQGLIAFAILLFLALAAAVLYLTIKRKARRRKWKAEKIQDDGELSENESRFDIDDEDEKMNIDRRLNGSNLQTLTETTESGFNTSGNNSNFYGRCESFSLA